MPRTADEKLQSEERHGEKRRSNDSPAISDESSKVNKTKSHTDVRSQPVSKLSAKEQIEMAKERQRIKMKLEEKKKDESHETHESKFSSIIEKTQSLANVFNPDSESEEEEMPMEAKMKMKNIGRDTPTACGPNSFGKGSLGFTNVAKFREREQLRVSAQIQKK